MKSSRIKTVVTLAVVALAVGAFVAPLEAAIITLGKVEPHRSSGWNIVSQDGGALITGTFNKIVSTAGFPNKTASTMNTGAYGQSLTGLTIDGNPGISLTWNLRLTASTGDGVVVNSEPWVVDKGQDGGSADITRMNAGETITFTIENMVLTGAPVGYSATFDGFTGMNDGGAGVFTTGTTGIASYNVTAYRIDGVDFGFTIVPEPATMSLLAIGGGVLLKRRRRRT